MFKLVTHVKHLENLREADYSHFDEFYLGDYTCLSSNSLSTDSESLKEAVDLLKQDSKRVYVSLLGFPTTKDLPRIYAFLSEIEDLAADGVEASSVGVIHRVLSAPGNGWEVHAGIFANVYTDTTAKLLKRVGVNRIFANPELSLDDMCEIQNKAGMDVVFQIHGKLPLTPTVPCIFKNSMPGFKCSQHISGINKKHVLKTSRWPEKHTLLCYGKLMVSGRDCCMMDHLHGMKKRGIRHFYINTWNESPEYVQTVSRVYREALTSVFRGSDGFDRAAATDRLARLSQFGFANGFYFSKPGWEFVSGEDIKE